MRLTLWLFFLLLWRAAPTLVTWPAVARLLGSGVGPAHGGALQYADSAAFARPAYAAAHWPRLGPASYAQWPGAVQPGIGWRRRWVVALAEPARRRRGHASVVRGRGGPLAGESAAGQRTTFTLRLPPRPTS